LVRRSACVQQNVVFNSARSIVSRNLRTRFISNCDVRFIMTRAELRLCPCRIPELTNGRRSQVFHAQPFILDNREYSIDVAAHDMATPSSLETNIQFPLPPFNPKQQRQKEHAWHSIWNWM
jgi:hypothetical protein